MPSEKRKTGANKTIKVSNKVKDQKMLARLPAITAITKTIILGIIPSQKTSYNFDDLYISNC